MLAALVIVAASIKLGAYRDYQLAEVAAYLVAVAGLTMLIGLSGQISIGHGAFMAIGAYAAALLLLHLHWPLEVVFVASVVITAVGGAIFGVAAARLRGPYLAGATLMLAVALPSVADKYSGRVRRRPGAERLHHHPGLPRRDLPADPVAGLAHQRGGADRPGPAGQPGPQPGRPQLAGGAGQRGGGGPGRPERRQAEDPGLRRQRGRRRARRRAARGGLTIVSPGAFTLALSIGLLTAAVIGGLGSLTGALWGSLLFVLVPTYLTNVASSHGFSSGASSSVPIAAYGIVLILVMLLFPAGIQGGVRRLLGPVTPVQGPPFSTWRRHRPATEHQEEGTR